MYEVGGQILSRTPHARNRVTIHGADGTKTVLTLRFTGMEPTRCGEYYAYTIESVRPEQRPRKSRTRTVH